MGAHSAPRVHGHEKQPLWPPTTRAPIHLLCELPSPRATRSNPPAVRTAFASRHPLQSTCCANCLRLVPPAPLTAAVRVYLSLPIFFFYFSLVCVLLVIFARCRGGAVERRQSSAAPRKAAVALRGHNARAQIPLRPEARMFHYELSHTIVAPCFHSHIEMTFL
jgi:hypothetical protein